MSRRIDLKFRVILDKLFITHLLSLVCLHMIKILKLYGMIYTSELKISKLNCYLHFINAQKWLPY